jgi:hypothetical protein
MPRAETFPVMRWVGVAWLAVWAPAYFLQWGWQNFLFFCDVAVVLTCIGVWRGSALLLSSQAVAAIVLNALWTLDVAWRLVLGHHLIGGTEYMWDVRFPLSIRLLSFFHVVWPPLLVWAVRRTGYDPRGLPLQIGIALFVFAASRVAEEFLDPQKNLNFVLTDPLFHRQWGPPPAHIALIFSVLIVAIYFPTHLALKRWMPPANQAR